MRMAAIIAAAKQQSDATTVVQLRIDNFEALPLDLNLWLEPLRRELADSLAIPRVNSPLSRADYQGSKSISLIFSTSFKI